MYDEKLLQQRLNEFKPEPLITPIKLSGEALEISMVKEDANNIDLAKANYLDVLNDPEIKKASEELIREYGVGTCGPRAFYGTTDVHLELENCLAKFLHMEESIVYSYGFVAISSSIAAYCKKGDVIFVDEHANFPIEQGLIVTKSRIIKFAHNDPEDFKAKLSEIAENEKKRTRKFLILEGISWTTGKLCPLPEFIEIAEQFKVRVFLEESYSLGVFGDTGRGLTEHFNIDPARIDMIFGTLEGAIGSIGGFCAGVTGLIEHQRLAGSGYIFSASLPTYLVKVVLKSLELLADKPKAFVKLATTFHNFLVEECKFYVESDPQAPFKLIKITPKKDEDRVYRYCKENGVHIIHNEHGLMVNLNVSLLEDEVRLGKVRQVFKGAAELIN